MRATALRGSNSIRRKLVQAVAQGATLASLATGASCSSDDVVSNEHAPNELNTPDAAANDSTANDATTIDARSDSTISNDPDATNAPDTNAEDSGSDSETTDAVPNGQAPESLRPYDIARLGCWGPSHDGGYIGQCCVKAHCYSPEGGAACASVEGVRAQPITPRFPPGSGTCGCRLGEGTDDSAAGPFATNPADPSRPAGECCYLIGS